MKPREKAEVFAKILEDHFRERLVSVILFGSVARGDERENSDIDLLVVLKGLPRGRYERRQILDAPLEKFLSLGFSTSINCHLKTPEEAAKITVLYLDFPSDAKILHDEDRFFRKIIERVSHRIEKSGAVRKKWGKFHYWDLKPGAKADETFEIL